MLIAWYLGYCSRDTVTSSGTWSTGSWRYRTRLHSRLRLLLRWSALQPLLPGSTSKAGGNGIVIKVFGVLGVSIVALGFGLYAQIGKTAETRAALRIFQAELAAQLDENQRVQSLLIEREKQAQATRTATQQKRTQAHDAIAQRSAEDCVNAALPDDLRVLLK